MERLNLHCALKILIVLGLVIGYAESKKNGFDFQSPFVNRELLDLFTFSPDELETFGKCKGNSSGFFAGNVSSETECEEDILSEDDLLKYGGNHSISRRALKPSVPERMRRPSVSLSEEGLLIARWVAPPGPPARHFVLEGRLGTEGPWKTVLVTSGGTAREARVLYPGHDKQWRLRVKAVYASGPGEPSEEVDRSDLAELPEHQEEFRKEYDEKSFDDVPVFRPLGDSEDSEEDYLEDDDANNLEKGLKDTSSSPTSCFGSSEIPGLEKCFERVNSSLVKNCLIQAGFGETPIQCHKKKQTLDNFKRLSEECLKEVYRQCIHNPMWRSKDLSNEIVVTLDIDSLQDMEVNECDAGNVEKLVFEAENCLRDKAIQEWPTPHTQDEELHKIFLVASYCLEEKQECVVNSRALFDRLMTSAMDLTGEFALQRIHKSAGKVDAKGLSACFESLDFEDLGCVDDFFDFAEDLLHDRPDPQSYRRIRSCFQESFDLCPESVLKLTVDTLLRATGAGGATPWPDGVWGHKKRDAKDVSATIPPVKPRSTVMDKCDPTRIKNWIRQVDSSIFPILHSSQVELEKSLRTTLYAVMHTLLVCHMQTLQSIQLAISEILSLIQQYCGCSDSCAKAIDYGNLEPCYVEMIGYYIKEYPRYEEVEILELFSKAKLCTGQKLKACPAMLSVYLSRLYLTILFGTECAADKGPVVTIGEPELHIKCQIIWSDKPCGDKLFIPPKPDCTESFKAPTRSYHQSFNVMPTEKLEFHPMTRKYSDKHPLVKTKLSLPQLDCKYWSPWISLYQPQSANFRYLELVLRSYCRNITAVECRMTQRSPDGSVSISKVPCKLLQRFICENSREGGCFGYEVRVLCWDCSEQIELPAPTSLERFTPKPKMYTARMHRPTEGYHMITVGSKSYHQRLMDVPKKKYLFKPHVTWFDFVRPKPTTAVYHWTPRIGKYGKKWRPTKSFGHIVPVTPKVYRGEVQPVTTAIELFIPPTKSYRQRWTPHPVALEKFRAKAKLYHQRVPTVATKIMRRTPPTKSYRFRITPGVAITHRIKMINIKHQQFKPQTTRSVVVHLPEVIEDKVFVPVPPTVVDRIHFEPRRYTQHMTPKMKTRGRLILYSEEAPEPVTRIRPTTVKEYYPFIPRRYTDYREGFTARAVKLVLNTDYEHHLAPKDTTTIVRYTPRPKPIRRETVRPTKASFFTIPFGRKNYGRKFADTTRRIIAVPPKVHNILAHFTVVPSTISMYRRHGCSASCRWVKVTGPQMPITPIVQACVGCRYPISIDCRVQGSLVDFRRTGDKVTCDLLRGFVCREPNPATCMKYEVRLICCLNVTFSPWLRTAHPSSPSGEVLPMRELVALYPCNFPVAIKCRALGSGLESLQQVVSCNLQDGLVCYNRDQTDGACFKYEVQLTCCQCGYKQKMYPTQLKYATAPLKPTIKHAEELIQKTTQVIYPPKPKTYRQKVTPPQDKFVHIVAPKIYHGHTFKPATYFVTHKPPGRKYTLKIIKSTQRPHFVPLTSGIHERFRTDATGFFKYKPPTKTYGGRITATTVKKWFAPLTSKKYQGLLENPPTKRVEVLKPRFRPVQKITPTVKYREFFPVTGRVYHGERENPPTTIVQSHFIPRRYTKKIMGTTTRKHFAPITVVVRTGTKKNPFRKKIVPVVVQSYTHRYEQSSTTKQFMPLEVKVYKQMRTNAPVTKYQCKHCYGEYHVKYSEDVYCTAPKGATLISCSDFYGSKENCSEILLTKWRSSLRECLVERGVYNVGEYVSRATFFRVKSDLLSCLLKVGDTACRKSLDMVSFLLQKIFQICRRRCDSKTAPQLRSLDVDVPRDLKVCISKVNFNELEDCYPGLHETLMDAFVYDKPDAYLQINSRNSTCLSRAFQHCDTHSLQSLEELVYENYGLCIEVTPPGQSKGCSLDTYSLYCSETDVRIFIGKTESCVRDDHGDFQEYEIAKRLDVLESCMKEYPINCIFPNWEVFKEVLFYLLDQILESPGGDKNCLEEFQPKYLQDCSQTLVSVISSFTASKVALNRGTMKTIQNCFRDSIVSCEAHVRSKFLSILQSVTHSAYLTDGLTSGPGPMFRSIDSVRSGNQEVNICLKRFEDLSSENSTLSDNDLCDPLLSSNNMSVSHVLKKSCNGDDVTRWLSDIKKCVHSQSTSPHGLTLVSLLRVIKSCNENSALECRPKERKEFKSIVNSLFYMINLFAVPSGSSSCLSNLKVDNIVRCHNHLHQYLVLDFKSSPEMHKRKSEDCLTSALKSCSKSFVLDLLSVLEKSVGKQTATQASANGSYMACEPGTQNFPRNAQEYKKYCRPRPVNDSPTKPIALNSGFRRLPVHDDDEEPQSNKSPGNYPSPWKGRGSNKLMENMFPNYLNENYEGSEEKGDYGSNLRNRDYDLNQNQEAGNAKSDENYAFYMSDLGEEKPEEAPPYVDQSYDEKQGIELSGHEESDIKPSNKDIPYVDHSYDEKQGIMTSGHEESDVKQDEAADFRPSYEVDPYAEDVGIERGEGSSGEKGGMSLMFRSLSNDLDDDLEEEKVTGSGNHALKKSSSEHKKDAGLSRKKVLELETSSKSEIENSEGSNEIFGKHKMATGSPKKIIDDVENCTIDDIDSYLDPLFDCQNIRMSLLFSAANQSTCGNITERSFESLALCLFEHRVPLTCEVSSRKQIEDFLSFLSLRMDTVMTYYRKRCSLEESPCYASGTKGFAHCSNYIYNHFVEPTAVRGPLKVFQCLVSAVPKCPIEIPLMFLPSVYLPLGMNLSIVLQETKERKCLAAPTEDIPTSSICTEAEQDAAKQAIYSCLNRTNQKINESLQGASQTLHWSVLPMTVCVSVYPILECRLSDLDKFKHFVTSFLAGIETWLRAFLKIFIGEADKKKGEDCLLRFSSPAMDKCLSLLFEFMTSFHSGHARASDYPSRCVEDVFGGCGDIGTFHLLMKKSMNVTYKDEEKDHSVNTCMGAENEVHLKNCDVKHFDSLLLSEDKCAKRGDGLVDVEEPMDFCKECILGSMKEMCMYEMPQLKEVISSALKLTEKCLLTQDVGIPCIRNVKMALQDKCLFDFYTYISNLKRGKYMKAAHFSRNTFKCINQTVTQCSSEVHSSIFNLYSQISGVETLSNYRADYVLGLNRAVHEVMML